MGVFSWEFILDVLSWRKAKIDSASFCEDAGASFFSCFSLSSVIGALISNILSKQKCFWLIGVRGGESDLYVETPDTFHVS